MIEMQSGHAGGGDLGRTPTMSTTPSAIRWGPLWQASPVTSRRSLLLAVLGSVGLLLAGCSTVFLVGEDVEPSGDSGYRDRVAIIYTVKPRASANEMDALLDTALAADTALGDAGAGAVGGNEEADGEYRLYFVGLDRHRMWQILEPVFAEAPLKWSRVELFQNLGEDPDEVILPR